MDTNHIAKNISWENLHTETKRFPHIGNTTLTDSSIAKIIKLNALAKQAIYDSKVKLQLQIYILVKKAKLN